MKPIDVIITYSKKGGAAAADQWHAARKEGLLDPKEFSRRDLLDLQIWSALLMKLQGSLTSDVLQKCVEFAEKAALEPKTHVVYLMFIGDLAFEAGVKEFGLREAFTAVDFDWELADSLSNLSRQFDKRVAVIRKAAKQGPASPNM